MIRTILITLVMLSISGCAERIRTAPGEIPVAGQTGPGEEVYGRRVLTELKRHYQLESSPEINRRVRRVVDNLAVAANAGAHPWHVYVFRDDQLVNAGATRGNHIFVWTGLLGAVRNDDELSAVLAHEIGHVLANHTQLTPAEEASQLIVGVASNAARVGVTAAEAPYVAGAGAYIVDQLLSAVFVNPNSQENEIEADRIGLYIMADAGYHPQAAVDFWGRLSGSGVGTTGSEIFSSHPSNSRRREELRRLMPGAVERFHRAARPASGQAVGFDSFNVDDGLTTRRRQGLNEVWVVVTEFAPVHSHADKESRIISHFFYGDAVRVRSLEGPWLESIEPLHGYIHRDFLAPANVQ